MNYELVFLVLLTLALQGNELEEKVQSCSLTPYCFIKTVNYSLPIFEKAANLSVLMMCGELEDNRKDEQKLSSKILVWLYDKPKNKAEVLCPDLYNIFFERLEFYHIAEKKMDNLSDIMEAYDFFLEFVADSLLLVDVSDSVKENYRTLTKLIGRWLYYIDAYDDLEKDMRNQAYNPFMLKNTFCHDEIICEINRIIVQIGTLLKSLPVKKYRELLEVLCVVSLEKKPRL